MSSIDNVGNNLGSIQILCDSKIPTTYKISCTTKGFTSNQQPTIYFESYSNNDFHGSIKNNQTFELPYHDNETITFYIKYSNNMVNIEDVVSDFIVNEDGTSIYAYELFYNGSFESESAQVTLGNIRNKDSVSLNFTVLKL